MLRTRILTAVVLAPLALAAVLYLPTAWIAVVFGIVIALAAYEWSALAGLRGWPARLAYVAGVALGCSLLYGAARLHAGVIAIGCAWWLVAVLAVVSFPRAEALFKNGFVTGATGIVVLIPAWLALMSIHAGEQGGYWLIWMLALVWGADIGAYFAGRAFGKRKLAPAVSPGKTWEGAFGGLLLAAGVCVPGLLWLTDAWLGWLPLLVLLVMISVFGDLFESVLKRSTGVKDSGALLPGHGGVLDRIDALVAVLPFTAYLLA